VFTSIRTDIEAGYGDMSIRMVELAQEQPGFLGVESARNEVGITVSYWTSLDAIQNWRRHAEHQVAQETGRDRWYEQYRVRICRVEWEYGFDV
jgi:heme-degrading monooxygenase HmoA